MLKIIEIKTYDYKFNDSILITTYLMLFLYNENIEYNSKANSFDEETK